MGRNHKQELVCIRLMETMPNGLELRDVAVDLDYRRTCRLATEKDPPIFAITPADLSASKLFPVQQGCSSPSHSGFKHLLAGNLCKPLSSHATRPTFTPPFTNKRNTIVAIRSRVVWASRFPFSFLRASSGLTSECTLMPHLQVMVVSASPSTCVIAPLRFRPGMRMSCERLPP
jgi:hypothetical protein